jgi:hypothetical protein
MNRIFSKCLLTLFLVPLTHLNLPAQNLTGIWRGYFITESNNFYKFEVQINQSGSFMSGVSYSYMSTVFYGKATLTGTFSKQGQSALIKEIRTVELRMSGGSVACIMKCIFKYSRSGKEEFLEGTFTSKYEKNDILTRKGEDCGGGKVTLRRVTTSDFYVEPFLRGKIKTTPVIVNKAPVKKDTSKAIVKTNPVTKRVTRPLDPPVTKTNTDSLKTKTNLTPTVKTRPPMVPPPPVLKNRSNELVRVLTVRDPDVTVKLYDNGEIDGDTISVYLDNKLVLSSKGLTAAPLTIKLKMDDENNEHELVMVAENLGRIPPNTSLMIVECGGQRFDVRITSTEQKNAMVRFKYEKPR